MTPALRREPLPCRRRRMAGSGCYLWPCSARWFRSAASSRRSRRLPGRSRRPAGPAWFEDVTDARRPRLRPRPRPDRHVLHAAVSRLRRRPLRLRRRRPARHLPAPERRARLGRPPTGSSASSPTARSRTSPPARAWTSPATAWAWPSATSTTTAGPTCCSPSTAASRLFLNHGDGTFTDVTEEAGLSNPLLGHVGRLLRLRPRRLARPRRRQLRRLRPVAGPARRPAGKPDYCAPQDVPGHASRKLFRNLGPAAGRRAVRFEDVTRRVRASAGCPGRAWACCAPTSTATAGPTSSSPTTASPTTCGSTSTTAPSRRRRRRAASPTTRMGQAHASMGIALGDVDGDGLLDLFVTHLTSETNTLWKQGPRGLFQRPHGRRPGLAAAAGAAPASAPLLADFDHDGALDLAVVNGRVAARRAGRRTRRCGRSGSRTPSATSCSPTTAPARSATSRRRTGPFCGTLERRPRPGLRRLRRRRRRWTCW